MHDLFLWLFKKREEPFEIAFLSFFHILYFVIIIGATLALAYYLNRHEEKRRPTLRRLAYAIVILYVADFFLQPFVTSDFTMNIDKLPFHVCTVLCPIVAFAEFNPRMKGFKEPIAILAIVGPLMYLVYPGNAIGEISPFCYKILQTFIYHGVLFSWGVNTLLSGEFIPHIKKCYKSLILILLMAVWATFGNLVYNTSYLGNDPDAEHFDWMFLTGSSFSFLPPMLMPLASITAIFGVAVSVYGLYHLYAHLKNRKNHGNTPNGDSVVF